MGWGNSQRRHGAAPRHYKLPPPRPGFLIRQTGIAYGDGRPDAEKDTIPTRVVVYSLDGRAKQAMNGRQHFVIGAATAGLGLWGAQAVGLQLESGIILAGALIAGVGSLAPDIDHPRSTISRGLPAELLLRALALLLLPVVFAVMVAMSGDFRGAFNIFQSLSQTSFVRWGLILATPAIVLIAASTIISALFGHRGATHSLIFATGATLVATVTCVYLNSAWWYGLLFGLGWLLHLLADATTEMGLPSLLWPFVN